MRELTYFSNNVINNFKNDDTLTNEAIYDNMLQFNELLMNTSKNVFDKYTKAESHKIILTQFNKILGIDYKTANITKRRQALRDHSKEIASLTEDILIDKMVSGWNESNAQFMNYVQFVNINDGDENEFFVEDDSLLQVSKFAGNHHNIVRQAVRPGVPFRVETSWYVIKTYADFEALMLGKIDLATYVDRMYLSIEANRYDALYTAFMSMDESLPTDMVLETAVTAATKDAIIEQIEAVKAAIGKEITLVGSRVAIQKLQSTVDYNMFSNEMKNERHQNGILGIWEGYDCLALSRVNRAGSRQNVLDNTKIFIMPVDTDPENRPIKLVTEGDVMYTESGLDGSKMDMTATVDIRYKEGIGVVINQLFGVIKIEQ